MDSECIEIDPQNNESTQPDEVESMEREVGAKRKSLNRENWGRMFTPALTKGEMGGRMDNWAHNGAVRTAKFNKNGDYFFTGGEDGMIYCFKSCGGKNVASYSRLGTDIRDVCITKDDKTLFSCGGDGQILCYDFQTAKFIREFGGHADGVNAISVNEFGSCLVTADSCVRLWDIRSQCREPFQVFDTFKGDVTSLCLTRTDIIAGSLDGTVQKFDLRKGTRLFHNIGAAVKGLYVGKDDETCILASCIDSTFQLLNVDAYHIGSTGYFKGHTCKSSKLGCCFSNEGTRIIGGSEDGRIFFWNLLTRVVVSKFDAHSAAVTSLDYHPTKNCMISAAMDGSVVLWIDPNDPI